MSINEGIIRHKRYKTDANGNHTLVSEWTSATTVEMEDGKTLPEALEEVTGVIDITQAEYDKLTTEQKNNGQIYNIIDAPDDIEIDAYDIRYNSITVGSKIEFIDQAIQTIQNEQETQNVHFSTDTELQLDTAKGGIRLEKIEGGQHKSANLFDINSWNNHVLNTSGVERYGVVVKLDKVGRVYFKYSITTDNLVWAVFDKDGNVVKSTTQLINGISSTYYDNTTVGNEIHIFHANDVKNNITYFMVSYEDIPYEPYGLHVSGDMALVDLAVLNWENRGNGIYSTTIESRKLSNSVQFEISNPYKNGGMVAGSGYVTDDMTFYYYYSSGSTSKTVYIVNKSTSDIKSALKDIKLAYELADGATPSQYALCVKEHGNNLWDEKWETGSITSGDGSNYGATSQIRSVNYINVKPNTSYYFVCGGGQLTGKFYDANKVAIGTSWGINTSTNKSIITPSNAEYFRFCMQPSYGTTYLNNIAIIEGTSGEYAPYEGKTVFIPLSQPLCEGNTIEKIGDKWFEVQKFGYVDLGTLTYSVSGDTQKTGQTTYKANFQTLKDSKKQKLICEKFTVNNPFVNENVADVYTMQNNYNAWANLSFTVPIGAYESKEDFKSKMSGVKLYYELATPTLTPLSNEQKIALASLESYEGQTFIDTADTYAKAELSVAYGKSDVVATALGADNKAEIEKYERESLEKEIPSIETKLLLNANGLSLRRSGNVCLLTFNGYNFTTPVSITEIMQNKPQGASRGFVTNESSIGLVTVDNQGSLVIQNVAMNGYLTGKMYGSVTWLV